MKNINIQINLNLFSAIILAGATVFALFAFKGNEVKEQKATQYAYLQISVVESVVKGGVGRSRMISIQDNGEMMEEKLQNFFSVGGINFKNVRFNDNIVTERISKLTNDGWELENVVTGAYGTEKTAGIFLTRYLFRKPKS